MDYKKPNNILIGLLLLGILLIGGYFRFTGLNWDDFSALHPDERYLTLNLLPVVGGQPEFTHDNERFPTHTLLTSQMSTLGNSYDFQANPLLNLGVVRGSLGAELGAWWLNEGRVLPYNSATDALQALNSGEVDVLLLTEVEADGLAGLNNLVLEVWESPRVQQVRCEGLHPETGGVGGYFDSYCSSLNPHNAGSGSYAYGTLPLFMAYFANDIVRSLSQGEGAVLVYPGTAVTWRFLSALFDVASILLIFFIGKRLHSPWVGLIAALLYACAPLAIQKAHYGTVNSITAFFVMLAIWAAVQVQDKGQNRYFVMFGLALGAALSGRINIVPLAGVVVLAAMVNAAPILDTRIAWSERERLLWRNGFGVLLAGFVTLITFRIFNPYAFLGDSFFGLIPNPRFLADAQGSSFAVSGASDAPPNWQWLGRASYLYPLRDMIFWGMGIGMGVMAWFGFAWSGYRLLRGREFATRNILLFAWVLVYFGWIGRLWVMTMRYFLPLYGSLALLAAWALYELYRQSRERELPMSRILLFGFGSFFAIIPAYYAYTGISLTPTAISAGVLALVLLLVAILPIPRRSLILGAFVMGFTLLWGLMFTNIYQHQLTRVQAARWSWENISGDFSMQVEGAPEGTPLINIALGNRSYDSANNPEGLLPAASRLEVGAPQYVDFVATASGTITSIHSPHLGDPFGDPDPEILYFSISRTGDASPLAEVTLNQNLLRDEHPLGSSFDIVFDTPIDVVEGESYLLKVEAIAGPIIVAGAVMLTEGTWDDRITTAMICAMPEGVTYADDPASGLVSYQDCNGRATMYSLHQSYDLAMSYPVDEQLKFDNMVNGLDVGDYLAITSNRFYDTETRNPARWPMTTAYYRALFNGELGYELVATFNESYEFGFLSVDDQHLPIYDSPAWFNELEADEAFHVYDHPTVFIFRKTEAYDAAMTRSILNYPMRRIDQLGFSSLDTQAQIVDVIYWDSLTADKAPTAIQQPNDRLTANTEGGTWSERFDSDSPLNTVQPLGVVAWWLTLVGIGLLAWPLLFTAFPNLGDKGYGFSKIVGLLLLAWIAWFASNFALPLWSQSGLFLLVLLLAGISLYLAYSRREAIGEYLREYWMRIALIELISLILFALFIGVRLSNPDLWHHPMGGEKPMDFAFFNAVLRTSYFPAYNPWASGEFINYYYFGYVIVGVPTLLLKIVPAFAYNLIIPSLFAMTGIGAFSAAFNIVDSWTSRSTELIDEKHYSVFRRMGNPWIAGISALLLCVILGNLDSPRVLIEEGIARLGGYERPTGLEAFLIDQYINEHNGVFPDEATLTSLQERAAASYFFDNLTYELSIRAELVNSFMLGLGRNLSGEILPIGSNRWYWAPTRTIQETPDVGGYAINELPYFTFLYGDLHAHMISMPLMLFVIAFVFYEVQQAKTDNRSLFAQFLSIFLGALSVGMFRAINTWDWPTFMLFVLVGLSYAWWLRWGGFSRASLTNLAIQAGGFVAIASFVVSPYTAWFASSYESIQPWTGGKTPLWAYWNIHGLFLFLLVSLLIWDTARFLRETHVRDIAGQGRWLLIGLVVIGALLFAAFIAALIEYQVALIVVPLVIWIALLFFRPNQAVPMQFVLVLAGLALSLTLGVEVIVLSGDIGRQNTVFKFYIQVWLLFSVMGGAAFAWIVQQADNWRFRLQALWFTPLMLLVAAAAMFPFTATRARMVDRFVPELAPTLNGLDYMQFATYHLNETNTPISLENDYAIIRWMQENIIGTPVILEGRGVVSEYHYNGRISINTGLPTILGWNWHQRQQHTLSPLGQIVFQREYNIQYFYNTEDIPSALNILRYYDVRYIVVSDMEQQIYPLGLEKFNQMLEMGLLSTAYEHNGAVVYEVHQTAIDSFTANQLAFNQAIGLDETFLPAYVPMLGMSLIGVNTEADVQMVLPLIAEREIEYLVLTNPARVLQYLPDVFDRFATLESLGVLQIVDDSEASRIYRVNRDVLNALMGED